MANEELVAYHNPIVPGFSPDPSVVFVDGVFYLANSSFHVFPGLPIYASRDLRTWTHIGNGINRPGQLDLDGSVMTKVPLDTGHFMIGAGGIFAPTIRHYNRKFYITCTNCVAANGDFQAHNFIISCTDIWAGDWSDPVYIPFYGIDPSLFFDDDGRVYFQGCYTIDRTQQPSCTIKQFEIDIETGNQLSDEREIWGGHAKYDTEGPHIYKVGKWYYLLVAEGGTFEHHMLCISRSENIWGPYEDFENNPIMTADGTNEYIQNMGHGELFQDGSGHWWLAGLGVRNENDGNPLGKDNFVAPLGRESFLTSVSWPEGGWPVVTQPKMEFFASPVKSADGLPSFVSPPSIGNIYIRTPDLSKYRIPQDGLGPLSLYPSLDSLLSHKGTSSFVGQRQRSLHSVATAVLDILAPTASIEVGLALYKDHLRHVSLGFRSDIGTIFCRALTLDLDNVLLGKVTVQPEAKQVQFKIESYPSKWVFLTRCILEGETGYSTPWIEVAFLETWKVAAREMTGPILGIFAHALREEDQSTVVHFHKFDVRF